MTYAPQMQFIADSIFDLETIVRKFEPVPLSWVVKYQDVFLADYAKAELKNALFIAAHVIPRRQLVLGAVSVARTVLKYAEDGDLRPSLAIEAVDKWLAGNASGALVKEASWGASEAGSQSTRGTVASNAAYAAMCASAIVFARTNSSAAMSANSAVAYATKASPIKKNQRMRRVDRNIMRSHMVLTVADVIAAGKNGWNPDESTATIA